MNCAFSKELRQLYIKFRDILFATHVRENPADGKPMKFEVNKEWFRNRGGPARPQSIKKQEELLKQFEL